MLENTLKAMTKLKEEFATNPSSKVYSIFIGLHANKIKIYSAHLFKSKIYVFDLSHNENNSLANSMLVFLMPTLIDKKLLLNLCSKPINNLKHEHLLNRLIEFLEKAAKYNFEIILITTDCYSMNTKVAKNIGYSYEQNEEVKRSSCISSIF